MGYSWGEAEQTRQLWRFSSKSEVEALRLGAIFFNFIILKTKENQLTVVMCGKGLTCKHFLEWPSAKQN